jgi:tetratricopeptide (TPR) repeat protein
MLRILYLCLAQFFLLTGAASAAPASSNTCEKEWAQVRADSRFSSITSKITQFESYAPSCAGSGLYEVLLAQLYIEEKDLGKAKQVLENALRQKMPHRKEILFKEAIIYGINQDLPHAEDIFKSLIRDYPKSYEGYSGLGDILLGQHRPKESIEQYEKANSFQPTVAAYRNLVIAYTQDGRFEDATNAFDKYYRSDKSALGDRDAALSVALAYEKQGQLEVADGALRALLNAKPEVKDDKVFVELFRKVNAELLAKKK